MTLERYRRPVRRLHTAVYVVTLLLLATGWWLLAGREGQPTPIARLTGIPDVQLHVWLGWALVAVVLLPLPFLAHSAIGFVRETLRYDQGDGAWLLRWPAAVLSGRFGRHEGHFDPGQRLANVAIVGLLGLLVASGIGLVFVHVGPLFAVLAAVHRLSTIGFTAVIAGHIVIALGILPGYHGVWRSMHLGGRLPLATARRIWPGWTERTAAAAGEAAERRSQQPTAGDRPRRISGQADVDGLWTNRPACCQIRGQVGWRAGATGLIWFLSRRSRARFPRLHQRVGQGSYGTFRYVRRPGEAACGRSSHDR
jgi:formate dehydrogenase subunit gamma